MLNLTERRNTKRRKYKMSKMTYLDGLCMGNHLFLSTLRLTKLCIYDYY
jgi:hypothetical protein